MNPCSEERAGQQHDLPLSSILPTGCFTLNHPSWRLLDGHVDVVGGDDGAEALLEALHVEYDGHRPYAFSFSAWSRLRSSRRLFQ